MTVYRGEKRQGEREGERERERYGREKEKKEGKQKSDLISESAITYGQLLNDSVFPPKRFFCRKRSKINKECSFLTFNQQALMSTMFFCFNFKLF